MDNRELEQVTRTIYNTIFSDANNVEIDGRPYHVELTSKSKLRKISYEGYTFIEQNPHKSSNWANLAREGHQIMWVMKGRRYLVRMMDGNYLKLN